MLVHIQTLADKPERLPLRVDLRVRNKHGALIYTPGPGAIAGTLTSVKIVKKRTGRGPRKFLIWHFEPDPGVELPATVQSNGANYAQVLLGYTSRNYYLATLDDFRLARPAE